MQNQNMSSLTESRIKRILELEPQLRQRTKKEAKRFLEVPRFPDISRDETLVDVVAPQMRKYFTDWNEDPAQFFKDRSRMLMIFLAIKAGGVQALIEKYGQLASGELLRSAINNMQEKGFGNPAAVEEMLPQAIENAENQIRQLQSVNPEEEEAVKNCMKEIEKSISSRGRK
ncbi:MAG TPA: hypothetical protein VNO24_15490 [Blastocatellia bacterium]|nr:hypothetical protein [Blastocatellia bacterium]